MRLPALPKLLACVFAAAITANGQVIINEISASSNDRLVIRNAAGARQLGCTPAWHELDYAVPAPNITGWWQTGTGPFGFGVSGVTTNVQTAMLNKTHGLYLRKTFTATAAQSTSTSALELVIDYGDGFIAYLNGKEVARRNAGQVNSYGWHDQAAFNIKTSGTPETINLGPCNTLLLNGNNVLSILALDQDYEFRTYQSNAQFFCSPKLRIAGTTPTDLVLPNQSWRYYVGRHEPSGGVYDLSDFASTVIVPEFVDWIELKNTGASAVNVAGWRITDDSALPDKWVFPANTNIPAGGFLVIAATGRNVTAPPANGILHTNFGLNAGGGYLALRDASGTLASELAVIPKQDSFHTWGRDTASGQYRYIEKGTPGSENAVGANTDTVQEVDFNVPTGFHTGPVNLTLSTLTPNASIRYTQDGSDPTATTGIAYTGPFNPLDKPNPGPGSGKILKEFFQPGYSPPSSIPANATPTNSQLLTTFETPSNVADGYTHRVRGFLHPPQTGAYTFWIASDDAGILYLSPNDQPSSKVQRAYVSTWTFPREWDKEANQQSTAINLTAGQKYYIEAVQTEGGGGDNLAIGWSGPGLSSGINVIEGRYLSPPATLPPGTTDAPSYVTIRARAFAAGMLPSEVRTRNYVTGMDSRLTAIPAFFLSGPSSDTFYAGNGIFSVVGGNWGNADATWVPNNATTDYNFCIVQGDAFERPASLEIINPGNVVVERTNVGTRFAGSAWSRPRYTLSSIENSAWNTDWYTKPQLNLFFRKEFGISSFRENGFFPTSDLKKWDQMRLRAGKNDAYNPFIIDEWMRRTFAGTSAPSPQGTFATLFINGQFKSYFNPTERPREPFFQEYYGSINEWDVQYVGEWEDGDGTAIPGVTSSSYGNMENFFRNNDFSTLANYNTGATYWDMTNVADYFIVNAWGATQDWPHNNFVFMRERAAGYKWRFSMWDAEGALGTFGQSNTHNTFTGDLSVNDTNISGEYRMVALVFRRAFQSPEFKLLFADRIQKHFFNNGVMVRSNMNARWTDMRTTMQPVIAAATGGAFYNGHWDNWANRDATFLSQCSAIGLWPAIKAPAATPFGGTISVGGTVTLTDPNVAPNNGGTIYYTTSGSDPRLPGGAVNTAGGATAYSAPFSVTSPITLKARILKGTTWSPIIEAGYAPPPPKVVVTELHYNPPGSTDATEFLEIANVGGTVASLTGATFTDGITYTFGNVNLNPGQTFVLVRDATAFAAAYPGVAIGGVYVGSLDNNGETLTLRDAGNAVIFSFTYYDSADPNWPAAADGDGKSLVLKRPYSISTNPNIATNWRASVADGGAPGAMDSTSFNGVATNDADGDSFNALVEYSLGTNDQSGSSFPVMTYSRDGNGRLVLVCTHPIAADDVNLEALESTDLTNWTPAVVLPETAGNPGWMNASWRSNAAGSKVFLRLKITKP